MSPVYYIDGAYVEAAAAALPLNDLAILRGYGVFDFFRTYGGLPIQIERNLQRLRNSAAVIRLEYPWTDNEIRDIVLETIRRNGFDEASVRLIVTGGSADDFITPQGQPRLLVYVEPVKPLPAQWYTDGVKVITVDEERHLPEAKSLNYIAAIIAQKAAREAGAIEALYVDRLGNVREGTTTNVFAFTGGTVVTPAVGILPGVTRGRVIEVLAANYTVEERPLALDELLRAEAVVMSSANKQVVPIVQINDTVIGDGTVGPHARHAMDAFHAYVMAEAERRQHAMS